MNFYPIYKNKKLLPWIKWWILKGNKVAPKHLSEWINSAEAITLTGVYKGSPLLNLNLNGNTSQTGTPSPEAPVPVNVVKGNNTIKINDTDYQVNLKSKNLFNYKYSQLRNINRVTISEETNGFKLTSTGVAGYGFASLPIDNNLLGKEVTISCNSTGNKTPSARLFYHNSSGSLTSNIGAFWTTNNANTVTLPSTLPSGSTGIDLVFYISQGNNAEGDYATFTNIQIEESSKATTYEPYYDYELCKIGDYQDVIYKENNKWYVDKYIEKVVLNGSESWSSASSIVSGTSRFYFEKNGIISSSGATNTNYYSDKFKPLNWEQIYSGDTTTLNGFCVYGYSTPQRIHIRIDNTYANSVSTFKTWLTNNNTNVYYVLATSTTTEITETTLLSQLEAIYNAKLQSGTNTITQTPSDLPFYLSFQYYEKG